MFIRFLSFFCFCVCGEAAGERVAALVMASSGGCTARVSVSHPVSPVSLVFFVRIFPLPQLSELERVHATAVSDLRALRKTHADRLSELQSLLEAHTSLSERFEAGSREQAAVRLRVHARACVRVCVCVCVCGGPVLLRRDGYRTQLLGCLCLTGGVRLVQ